MNTGMWATLCGAVLGFFLVIGTVHANDLPNTGDSSDVSATIANQNEGLNLNEQATNNIYMYGYNQYYYPLYSYFPYYYGYYYPSYYGFYPYYGYSMPFSRTTVTITKTPMR